MRVLYRRVSVTTAAAAALLLSFNRNENFRELHTTKQKLKTARDAFQSISHVLLNKAVAIYYQYTFYTAGRGSRRKTVKRYGIYEIAGPYSVASCVTQ